MVAVREVEAKNVGTSIDQGLDGFQVVGCWAKVETILVLRMGKISSKKLCKRDTITTIILKNIN